MTHSKKKFHSLINKKNNPDALVFVRFKNTRYGGAERYLARVIEQLKENKIHSRTFHSDLPSWLPSWLKVLLFSRKVCYSKSDDDLYFSLDRITCPDIYRAGDGVHKAFLRTKGISLNPLHLSYLWLERRTFENAKLIIANSRMVKAQILEHYPQIDEKKISVIYNGVPIPDRIEEPDAKTRIAAEFGIDLHKPILLFVGSGFRRKGVAEFLEILSHIDTEVNAFVVGKEKRMRRYKKLARSLGVEHRVTFTGPRKDVETFFSAADLFLFPTHYEPFSNVVLEALSYATPVFTTRQNGAHEILSSFFVMENPHDLSIVNKINKLLLEPKRLKEAKAAARKTAECYPIERNARETIDAIESIL